MISRHLGTHWHHHLALWSTLATALLVSSAAAAVHHARGGYRPAPLPPPSHIAGAALPISWSLDRWVVRVHNQSDSNSCVGQTAATIEEIIQREASHRPIAFSSGFVWNQLNGGVDQGISYPQAFSLLATEGDAPLSAFPPDGATDRFLLPGPATIAAGAAYRIAGWFSVSSWDRQTIETELHAGRPLAIAIPVFSSFYNQWGEGSVPFLAAQFGSFLFWHSMTVVGYSPFGVELLNSWGPGWGGNGRAWLSWSFIGTLNAPMVAVVPRHAPGSLVPGPAAPVSQHGPTSKPAYRFPYPAWTTYMHAHRWPKALYIWPRTCRPVRFDGKTRQVCRWTWAASVWSRERRYRRLGGIAGREAWYVPGPARAAHAGGRRRHGFTRTPFAAGAIFTWPDFHTAKAVFASPGSGGSHR